MPIPVGVLPSLPMAAVCSKSAIHGKLRGVHSTVFPWWAVPVPVIAILRILMRIAVDAHAIGRHLTGNEVYVRSLLREFANLDNESEFVAYVSEPGADRLVPRRFKTKSVAADPYFRLGWDLSRCVAADRPDLLHVQY